MAAEIAPTVVATEAPVAQETLARAESVLGQVRMRLVPDLRRATLHLEPAELGRMSIDVSVEDGSVRAELRVESVETLASLERFLPELRAMFAQAELEVSEIDIQLAGEDAFEADARADADAQQDSGSAPDEGSASASEVPDLSAATNHSVTETGINLLA